MSRGRFITLEGGEGVGKTTQATRLGAWLASRGIAAVVTREPGGSEGAEAVRELLLRGPTGRWDAMTETLLHFAARRDHLRATIAPALERGDWVVCDRFADSTRAYQGVVQGVGRELVERLYGAVVGALAPDLTLVLDLPAEEGLRRAGARGAGNRYERMGPDFHRCLRQAFRDIAAAEPGRCVTIDAGGDADRVFASVAAAVGERWP